MPASLGVRDPVKSGRPARVRSALCGVQRIIALTRTLGAQIPSDNGRLSEAVIIVDNEDQCKAA